MKWRLRSNSDWSKMNIQRNRLPQSTPGGIGCHLRLCQSTDEHANKLIQAIIIWTLLCYSRTPSVLLVLSSLIRPSCFLFPFAVLAFVQAVKDSTNNWMKCIVYIYDTRSIIAFPHHWHCIAVQKWPLISFCIKSYHLVWQTHNHCSFVILWRAIQQKPPECIPAFNSQ